jgi:hypothetical protein
MTFYSGLADTSARLLKQLGKKLTIKTQTGSDYNPNTQTNTPTYKNYEVDGVVLNYSGRLNESGTLVQTDDKKIIVSASTIGKDSVSATDNLLIWSNRFDNATWVKSGAATVTTLYGAAPDNTNTATLFKRTASSGQFLSQTIAKQSAALPYCATMHVKKVATRYYAMRLQGAGGVRADAVFDLDTGAVQGTSNSGFSSISAAMAVVVDGWFRCSLSAISDSAASLTMSGSFNANATYVDGTDSAGTSSGLIWGAQVEDDLAPSAYIPSIDTFVSRASTATYIDASGIIQTAGVNVARNNSYGYGSIGVIRPIGLLVEEQRTNLLLRSTLEGGTAGTVGSGAVAPTGWTFPFTGGSVSYPTSPFGTGSVAYTKTLTTDRPFIQQSLGVLASTAYTLSCRVSQAATGTMKLGDLCAWASLPSGSSQAYYKNGVLTTASAVETLQLGDVISAVLAVSTTAGTSQARVGLGAAGDTSVTGTVSLTMPQVEAGATPSSYMPTTSAQVTRAADIVTSAPSSSPAVSTDLTTGALVVDGATTYVVQSVKQLNPAGTPLLFELQGRA